MINGFHYEHITKERIEKMLYLIAASGSKTLGKQFDRLSLERQQKITVILEKRARRLKNGGDRLDIDIITEVINDAKKDFYVLD